jgi:hypothetical protein
MNCDGTRSTGWSDSHTTRCCGGCDFGPKPACRPNF